MVFHWSLSDSKSPQVSRTLLSILVVLNNVVVSMVSTRPPNSKNSSPFNSPLVIVLNAPITIGIIVKFLFHIIINIIIIIIIHLHLCLILVFLLILLFLLLAVIFFFSFTILFLLLLLLLLLLLAFSFFITSFS